MDLTTVFDNPVEKVNFYFYDVYNDKLKNYNPDNSPLPYTILKPSFYGQFTESFDLINDHSFSQPLATSQLYKNNLYVIVIEIVQSKMKRYVYKTLYTNGIFNATTYQNYLDYSQIEVNGEVALSLRKTNSNVEQIEDGFNTETNLYQFDTNEVQNNLIEDRTNNFVSTLTRHYNAKEEFEISVVNASPLKLPGVLSTETPDISVSTSNPTVTYPVNRFERTDNATLTMDQNDTITVKDVSNVDNKISLEMDFNVNRHVLSTPKNISGQGTTDYLTKLDYQSYIGNIRIDIYFAWKNVLVDFGILGQEYPYYRIKVVNVTTNQIIHDQQISKQVFAPETLNDTIKSLIEKGKIQHDVIIPIRIIRDAEGDKQNRPHFFFHPELASFATTYPSFTTIRVDNKNFKVLKRDVTLFAWRTVNSSSSNPDYLLINDYEHFGTSATRPNLFNYFYKVNKNKAIYYKIIKAKDIVWNKKFDTTFKVTLNMTNNSELQLMLNETPLLREDIKTKFTAKVLADLELTPELVAEDFASIPNEYTINSTLNNQEFEYKLGQDINVDSLYDAHKLSYEGAEVIEITDALSENMLYTLIGGENIPLQEGGSPAIIRNNFYKEINLNYAFVVLFDNDKLMPLLNNNNDLRLRDGKIKLYKRGELTSIDVASLVNLSPFKLVD